MSVLSRAEQETFDTPPGFNSAERKQSFDFPSALQENAETFRTPANRLGFLVACGYFKACKRFFRPQDYHQNTRAVAVGNPREFTQGDKEEQEIAEACNRLIKNAIICWNYLYLSQQLARIKEADQKERLLAAIASHSVICWEHTNLLGEYDFSDNKLKDSAGITLPKIAA